MKKLIILILFLILFLISFFGFASTQGPLSPGTTSNIAIAGSTSSWNNSSNAKTSNNSYSITASNLASNGDYSDYLRATNFSFSIPVGSTINGIIVEVEDFDSGTSGKAKDNRVRIVKGGTIGATDKSGGGWAGSDPNSYTSYGSATDLWGETWTDTDINASNFGLAISAKRQGGGGTTCFPAIDHIRITVYYTSSLPIKLLFFKAENLNNEYINLTWETGVEINNDYFEIQKSINCINWATIGIINGSDNSIDIKKYSIVDNIPISGINYYRLKQVDYDGKNEFSYIISINYNNIMFKYYLIKNSENIFNVKTPFSDEITFMNIVDMNGKIIYKNICDENIELFIPEISLGIYYMYVYNSTYKHTEKILIK